LAFRVLGGAALKPGDKLYWARFLGGVAMGLLTGLMRLYEPTIFLGIALAVAAYIISAIILRAILSPDQRMKLGRGLYLSGATAYAAMWVISLIIVSNML
jgi:predicted lipid-binding transport protein (Tim44 family)